MSSSRSALLSGGERARLALALLALGGANFLLLDEPTNHLDIPAREALQEVLERFSGTILLVSHDRYLINRLATQIWDLRERKLVIFKGSYQEYLLRRAVGASPSQAPRIIMPAKPLIRADNKKSQQQVRNLAALEERIRAAELSIQRLSSEMQRAGEAQAFERAHQLGWKLAETQAELDRLMADWEKLAA